MPVFSLSEINQSDKQADWGSVGDGEESIATELTGVVSAAPTEGPRTPGFGPASPLPELSRILEGGILHSFREGGPPGLPLEEDLPLPSAPPLSSDDRGTQDEGEGRSEGLSQSWHQATQREAEEAELQEMGARDKQMEEDTKRHLAAAEALSKEQVEKLRVDLADRGVRRNWGV